MSLDVYLKDPVSGECLFEANITHNLGRMAAVAGIYEALWRPEELSIERARDLAPTIERGLMDMVLRPSHYRTFDSSNRWGVYDDFLPWIANYLEACKKYPDAKVCVSR